MSHWNTTSERGQTLINFESKARTQERTILELFEFFCRPLAWFEVQDLLVEEMNQCSIKRALSNLKAEGKLIKTDIKVIGKTGRPSYQYKYVIN